MCKCTPNKRTPFCGKSGCEWPKPEGAREQEPTPVTIQDRLRSLMARLQPEPASELNTELEVALGDAALTIDKLAATVQAMSAHLMPVLGTCPTCGGARPTCCVCPDWNAPTHYEPRKVHAGQIVVTVGVRGE